MKYLVILIATAMLSPVALAGSNEQSGTQTGTGWSESSTVDVEAGTQYTLTGIAADFDIFFYDASGRQVGYGIACGDDAGTVPSTAVSAQIRKWDDVGAVVPCTVPGVGLPGVWTYTDGL